MSLSIPVSRSFASASLSTRCLHSSGNALASGSSPLSANLRPQRTKIQSPRKLYPPTQLKSNPSAARYTISPEELEASERLPLASEPEHAARPLDTIRTNAISLVYEPKVLRLGTAATVELHQHFITIHLDHMRGVASHSQLRDACACEICVDPSTRQRSHTTGEAFHAASMGVPMIDSLADSLRVQWTDGHVSVFGLERLRDLISPTSPIGQYLETGLKRILWHYESELPRERFDYQSHQTGDGLLRVLEQVQRYGVVVLSGVPTIHTDDAKCELRAFALQIGQIRQTFYGETWDVKNMPNSKNIAYTDRNLGLHMDLLYFSEAPRFQLLHCLRNRVEGGMSYFVDSFAAAVRLEAQDKEAATRLQACHLDYVYDNDGHYLHNRRPILPTSLTDLRSVVNWSPPFQGLGRSFMRHPGQPVQQAIEEENVRRDIAKWEAILADPQAKYECKLEEGEMVLFDNRRVLHARTAFRDLTDKELRSRRIDLVAGEPTRWLKGCYLDGDVVWDRLATLHRHRQYT